MSCLRHAPAHNVLSAEVTFLPFKHENSSSFITVRLRKTIVLFYRYVYQISWQIVLTSCHWTASVCYRKYLSSTDFLRSGNGKQICDNNAAVKCFFCDFASTNSIDSSRFILRLTDFTWTWVQPFNFLDPVLPEHDQTQHTMKNNEKQDHRSYILATFDDHQPL